MNIKDLTPQSISESCFPFLQAQNAFDNERMCDLLLTIQPVQFFALLSARVHYMTFVQDPDTAAADLDALQECVRGRCFFDMKEGRFQNLFLNNPGVDLFMNMDISQLMDSATLVNLPNFYAYASDHEAAGILDNLLQAATENIQDTEEEIIARVAHGKAKLDGYRAIVQGFPNEPDLHLRAISALYTDQVNPETFIEKYAEQFSRWFIKFDIRERQDYPEFTDIFYAFANSVLHESLQFMDKVKSVNGGEMPNSFDADNFIEEFTDCIKKFEADNDINNLFGAIIETAMVGMVSPDNMIEFSKRFAYLVQVVNGGENTAQESLEKFINDPDYRKMMFAQATKSGVIENTASSMKNIEKSALKLKEKESYYYNIGKESYRKSDII